MPSLNQRDSHSFVTSEVAEAIVAEAAGGQLVDTVETSGRLIFTFHGLPPDFEQRLEQIQVRGGAVIAANHKFVALIRRARTRRVL